MILGAMLRTFRSLALIRFAAIVPDSCKQRK
jgi:hypothetical protein